MIQGIGLGLLQRMLWIVWIVDAFKGFPEGPCCRPASASGRVCLMRWHMVCVREAPILGSKAGAESPRQEPSIRLIYLAYDLGLEHNVLYCTVLYCTVLYCTVLYCTVLYCTVLYCTVLYCTVLYCTVLYCTVLYCTVLYDTILYYTILYYTMLYYGPCRAFYRLPSSKRRTSSCPEPIPCRGGATKIPGSA